MARYSSGENILWTKARHVRWPEEVFIEISSDVIARSSDTLATIAHELTHQYLESNGFPATDGPEYELFTGTAAIFLGMGKLILNGSTAVGYLGFRNAALVYLLCCAMRRIPEDTYTLGLSKEIATVLSEVRKINSGILSERFFSNQIEAKLITKAEQTIRDAQTTAWQLAVVVTPLAEALRKTGEVAYCEIRDVWTHLNGLVSGKYQTLEHDACAVFLRTLEAESAARRNIEALGAITQKYRSTISGLKRLTKSARSSCPALQFQAENAPFLINCLACGKGLRVPCMPKSATKLRCPQCQDSFSVGPTAASSLFSAVLSGLKYLPKRALDAFGRS